MNKIKLLYDVVTTMKEKEFLKGTLKVEGSRDKVKIFGFDNDFEKNLADGRTKAKVCLELDCEGKKVKHESSTEFELPGFQGHRRHGLMSHMRFHHCHGYYHNNDQAGDCSGIKCDGLKGKLSKIAFVLNMLNSMKVEELEDKSIKLSLDFDEASGDMQGFIREKLQQHKKMHHNDDFQCACSEFSGMEISAVKLNVFINKNSEVKKVILTVDGLQKDEINGQRSLNLKAELSFI
ncbi:MAG: hypothetical protein VR69_03535 [Peptococcaceae bacterium BRH_c4b]|nr:MAG: hypothetical protein VR69_03535 [Peptococcaceae bacterium BRH_c4b]